MLIILGPALWSDEFSLLLSTLSRLHSGSPASVQKSNQELNLRGSAESKRNTSNPFEILYDKQKKPNHTNQESLSNVAIYKTPSYIKIEQEIQAGHSMARASGASRHKPCPPVVTVIEDQRLKRGGLVVSRLASLRHRNSIRLRNKMVRRHDLEGDSSPPLFSMASTKKIKKKRPRLSFVFPIRRRTSFKYHPVSLNSNSQRFESQKDVDEYFIFNNIAAVMKEMIPRRMLSYDYSGLAKVEPRLNSHPAHFAISRASEFIMVLKRVKSTSAATSLRGERLVERKIDSSPGTYSTKTPSETLSAKERRQVFIKTAYNEYRDKVFAGKNKVPPRLNKLLPLEAEILTPEEKVAIDTKLALEVLLRRTLAAKIDYRLKKSGYSRRSDISSYQRAGDSNSDKSSSSSSSNFESHSRHADKSYHHNDSSHNSEGSSSVDTGDNMKHDASVSSDHFPSPQVSHASRAFGHHFNQNIHRNLHPKESSSTSNDDSMHFDQIPSKPDFNNTPKTYLTSSSVYSEDTKSKTSRPKRPPQFSNVFVNHFNKFHFESEKSKEELNYDERLSNLDLYSFKPMNRSNVTLSTSGANSGAPEISSERASGSTNFGNKLADQELMSFISSYHREIRNSRSTRDTSVIHSLANSVSEYLILEGGMEHISGGIPPTHTNIASPDKDPSSTIHINSVNHSACDVADGIPLSVNPTSPQNPSAIQRTDRVIDDNQHYLSKNIVPNRQKENEYDRGLLGINDSTSLMKVEFGSHSINKDLVSVKSPFYEDHTETSYSKASPSASLYSSIAPLNTSRSTHNTSCIRNI